MTDRDELLRQIGARVVERLRRSDGFQNGLCPACGGGAPDMAYWDADHEPGCELTRYLEATDGDL